MANGEAELIPGMDDIPARVPAMPARPSAKAPARKTSKKGARRPAEVLPVARVAVDMPLPHLDRPFDYLVPVELDADAVAGCRVRVRFAGRLVDGFLLERVAESDHEGRLGFLERVTSPEPVLAPEIAALAREVADRYAGTLADVLRLAIPPRHARTEATPWTPPPKPTPPSPPANPSATPPPSAPTPNTSAATPSATSDPTSGTSEMTSGASDAVSRESGAVPGASAATPLATSGAVPGAPEPASGASGAVSRGLGVVPNASGATPLATSDPASGTSEVASGASGAVPGGCGGVSGGSDAASGASGTSLEASGGRLGGSGSGPAPGVKASVMRAVPGSGTGALPGAVGGVDPWAAYPAGGAYLTALKAGRAPRAVWTAMPGPDWPRAIAAAVKATLESGRGALVVVADGREVARVDRALQGELGPGEHLALTAELGPAERYKRWLSVRRGQVRVLVGTRAAMFAPVSDLGLVVLWDEGDDVHAEPHAPYPHAREVLALRAHRQRAAALIGGFSRTADATQLIESGWAHPLVPDRTAVRRAMPQIKPAGSDAELARDEAARTARLPALAFRAARQALEHGPVLVQVPRRGYLPALACGRCRGPARCGHCQGPLSLTSSHAVPFCRWCGRLAGDWRCPECGSPQVRAVVVGAGRTAEELGRAFPGVTIKTSGRDAILAEIGTERTLVVSTPGAEPVAAQGYAAALLLDGWVLLGRADLRATEEALRRWMNAAALVRPGGEVVVVADGTLPPVQALVRWDPVTLAERELAERRELGFPPAVRMASLTGTPTAVRELVNAARLPDGAEVLGPVPAGTPGREGETLERALIRVGRPAGVALAQAIKAAQGVRSARKTPEVVRVQLDPLELI